MTYTIFRLQNDLYAQNNNRQCHQDLSAYWGRVPKSLAPFGAWLLWGGAIGRYAHRARNSRHLYQDCATLPNNQCSIATTAARS